MSETVNESVTSLTTSTSVASNVSAPVKLMSYKQLEDTVEQWLHDLDKQEKTFLDQASRVNMWDKQLIENGEIVSELNNVTEKVKTDQLRLDRELDFILSQQEELEELLQPIEAKVREQQTGVSVQYSDNEREAMSDLAENVDVQLKNMMGDLREVIDRINQTNISPNQNDDDTMTQISKILNSHMESLQWIDQSTEQLQRRVGDVSQRIEIRQKHFE